MSWRREVQFPITVRQAQKLVHKGEVHLSSIGSAIGVDGVDLMRDLILNRLAQLASKNPNYLLTGANPPSSAQHLPEEQVQEGDNSTDSQENSQISSGGGEGRDCPETGSAMSGSSSESHAGQSSTHQLDDPSSTAMEGIDRTDGNGNANQSDQSRDAGVLEGSGSLPNADSEQSGEGNHQPADDRPAHQKKWGKKFTHLHGGITAQLDKIDVEHFLIQLCRAKLGALIGNSCQNPSARRDYAEFCTRLKTYRNPSPARKEEEGRATILIMADVSGSCSGFSGEALKVAKAASRLGVASADVLVLSHSNGSPEQMELNGKAICIDFSDGLFDYEYCHWYKSLIKRYQIEIVVALGDWDAVNIYEYVINQPQIQRLIWLDNAYCSRGVKDQTRLALFRLKGKGIKHKLKYIQGCKDAKQFIQNIK